MCRLGLVDVKTWNALKGGKDPAAWIPFPKDTYDEEWVSVEKMLQRPAKEYPVFQVVCHFIGEDAAVRLGLNGGEKNVFPLPKDIVVEWRQRTSRKRPAGDHGSPDEDHPLPQRPRRET